MMATKISDSTVKEICVLNQQGKDPIEIAKTRLKALGLLNDTILNEIEANVQKELERAVEFARNSPDPMPEDALTDLFA